MSPTECSRLLVPALVLEWAKQAASHSCGQARPRLELLYGLRQPAILG